MLKKAIKAENPAVKNCGKDVDKNMDCLFISFTSWEIHILSSSTDRFPTKRCA
jgi:hypothetical protein